MVSIAAPIPTPTNSSNSSKQKTMAGYQNTTNKEERRKETATGLARARGRVVLFGVHGVRVVEVRFEGGLLDFGWLGKKNLLSSINTCTEWYQLGAHRLGHFQF